MFLQLPQIKKSFGRGDNRVEVLKGIDLAVEKVEFCLLLSPSGSEKSTFLNILSGIDRSDSGDIRIGGYEQESTDPVSPTAFGLSFSNVRPDFQSDRAGEHGGWRLSVPPGTGCGRTAAHAGVVGTPQQAAQPAFRRAAAAHLDWSLHCQKP